jgi:hypothetical protein
VADFSWAASMWGELALLGAALAFPLAGGRLCLLAAVVAVTETLRGLIKYLRPSSRPQRSARLVAPLKGADPQLERQPPEPVVER